MNQEPFAVGDSFLHRLDPRCRLAGAGLYSFAVALSSSMPVIVASALLSPLLVLWARLPARHVIRRVALVNVFNLLLWVVLPLTYQDPSPQTIGPLTWYRSGAAVAAQITLKSNAIVLALMALVATMSFSTLGHALGRLGVPDKIVHLFLMTYRYVFVLEQEYRRLIRAARIRAFEPTTSLHTYKTYAYIVGMLLVRSSVRAERVYRAMLCRGFQHRFYSLQEFRTGPGEWLFGAGAAAVLGGLVVLEWLAATAR